nr:hypothetical protein [Tanacetum cinerariifolium]
MEDDVDIITITMEQYLVRVQDDIRPGVVKPKIDNGVEFKINSNFMRELRCKLFKGTNDEDVHEHVRRVLEIADLFHFPGVTHDVVMFRVFPITLKGPALRWINRILAGEFQNLRRDVLNRGVYSLKKGQGSEKVKARTTMGKENVKEPVPRDLPVVQTYVPTMKFLGSPSRTHESICMMGIPKEIHKIKAHEDEGNTDDG